MDDEVCQGILTRGRCDVRHGPYPAGVAVAVADRIRNDPASLDEEDT